MDDSNLLKITDRRCAEAGVQDSTPAGVSVFQQESEQDRSGYFWLEQEPEQEWFF